MPKAKKNITRDLLHSMPDPQPDDYVGKVVALLGGNSIHVELLGVDELKQAPVMCRVPNKFKDVLHLRIGSYLLVHEETTLVNKLPEQHYEVVTGLFAKQIAYMKKHQLWPIADDDVKEPEEGLEVSVNSIDDELALEMPGNHSKNPFAFYEDSSSSSSSEDEEEEA